MNSWTLVLSCNSSSTSKCYTRFLHARSIEFLPLPSYRKDSQYFAESELRSWNFFSKWIVRSLKRIFTFLRSEDPVQMLYDFLSFANADFWSVQRVQRANNLQEITQRSSTTAKFRHIWPRRQHSLTGFWMLLHRWYARRFHAKSHSQTYPQMISQMNSPVYSLPFRFKTGAQSPCLIAN